MGLLAGPRGSHLPRVALLLGVAGCFGPEVRPCTVRCGAGATCPPSAICGADGYCHDPADTASCLAADAPSIDGATDAPPTADAPAGPDGANDAAPGDAGPILASFGDRTGSTHPGACVDTWIDENNTGANYGTSGVLRDDGEPDQRILLRCDLSSIPPTATVLEATLRLATNDDNLESGSLQLYRLLEAWTEDAATFDQRLSGTSWSTMGAGMTSHDPSPFVLLTPSAIDTDYAVTLPVATVQGWVANPSQNFGAVFISTTNSGVELHARESTLAARRPLLEVRYRP